MMSRKDFIAFAKMLNLYWRALPPGDSEKRRLIVSMIEDVGYVCRNANSNFDTEKFYAAATKED